MLNKLQPQIKQQLAHFYATFLNINFSTENELSKEML